MTVSPELLNAYRYQRSAVRTVAGALALARKDVAAGVKRFPHTGKPYAAVAWDADKAGLAYIQSVDGAGLRLVGNVECESYGARDCWSRRDVCGWFTDPDGHSYKDGTGLCWGVVYQLPARNGAARFVPGYQMGGTDSPPTLDFGCIQSSSVLDVETNPRDLDAAREAARVADSMAQRAAEEEREYQTAWQAGQRWADCVERIKSDRSTLSALLVERKAAKAMWRAGQHLTAICSAVTDKARALLDSISESRAEQAALSAGDDTSGHASLYWFAGDKRLREAFNEGAGRDVLAI